MKELTIEQKAKRYDEALENARHYHNEMGGDVKCVLEECFSELKDGKWERIKNLIYCLIRDRSDNGKLLEHNGVTVKEALAWLEKQGKQKSADIQSIEKRAHEVFPDDDDENTPLYRQAFIDGAVDYIDCGCKNSTWSEDDKGILLSIKCVIDNIWHSTSDIDTGGYSKEELKEMWEWLDKIWQRVESHEEKLDKKDE